MKSKNSSIHNNHNMGMQISFFFYLDFLLLFLVIITVALQNNRYNIITISLLLICILLFLNTFRLVIQSAAFVGSPGNSIYKKKFKNPENLQTEEKVYFANNETILSPVAISMKMFSDILINKEEVTLRDNLGRVANISIIIPDNYICHIILDNVNLHGYEKPCIQIGNNSSVTLELIGDNTFSNNGIRVPESSDITIIGEGNLLIQVERAGSLTIGGTSEQSYGNITLASTGSIKVVHAGIITAGIGGGYNTADSVIKFLSGNISVESSGAASVGVGCLNGNARIEVTDCKIRVHTEATRSVGIGCLKGYLSITTSGDLNCLTQGRYAVSIGVLDASVGSITVRGGCIIIHYNSHIGALIGAIHGKIDISILNGEVILFGEGTDIVGIGNQSGLSNTIIKNGLLSVQLFAANAIPIGNIQRNVVIDGGNIQCDFPPDIIPVNSYHTPLVAHILTATDEFRRTIETVSYSYEYQATYSSRFPYIKVYLPEYITFNN